jgi:tyrosine-specific transport protein
VLSTAFLITANTVGASCLILPDLAAGPGFMNTCIVSLGVYIINLVSGLCMAEVAIKQYEADGADVPSSFKEFADKSFQSDIVANIIATISILTNACVLVFTFAKAGEMASTLLAGAVDPTVASLGFVTALGAMMSTFTAGNLSTVASMCVGALFVAFGGFLIPGLMAVQDPWGTLTAPGIDASLSSVGQVVPIILLSLVYQNIVPSVTKILNYDRKKTVASLSLGSFIPLAMYLLFCFASLGGGLDVSSAGGPLMTLFTLATIGGSSVGTSMSVAEEFDSFFKTNEKDQTSAATSEEDELAENYVFSLPAVVAALVVPVLGDMLAGEDMTGALSLAGSFGSPLLYGVVPAIMAWNQRQEEKRQQQNLVPGGFASLGALGLAATGFVGQELAHVLDSVALAVA